MLPSVVEPPHLVTESGRLGRLENSVVAVVGDGVPLVQVLARATGDAMPCDEDQGEADDAPRDSGCCVDHRCLLLVFASIQIWAAA